MLRVAYVSYDAILRSLVLSPESPTFINVSRRALWAMNSGAAAYALALMDIALAVKMPREAW